MKLSRSPLLIRLFLSLLPLFPVTAEAQSVGETLERLKETIENSQAYDNIKEDKIQSLKMKLSRSPNASEHYRTASELAGQYSTYVCDSALHYINLAIRLARENGDTAEEVRSIFDKCDILGRAGLFTEARQLLFTINPAILDPALKQRYYSVAYAISQYMFENTIGTEYEREYYNLTRQYCDSAYKFAAAPDFDRSVMHATRLIESGNYSKAVQILDSAARKYAEGEREYSMIRSIQAVPELRLHPDGDSAIISLAGAAISDIKGSIKENMAIRQLAELLYKRGNVEMANLFVKKSMEDASFFSARMRSTQVGQMLPLIDRQYESLQKDARNRLRLAIYVLVFVAVVFAVGMFFIVRLAHRLRRANTELKLSNRQIGQLNVEIRDAAETTRELNVRLREANRIKETYLSQFMEMSSRSINSLERFRKSMTLLLNMGKMDELRKSLGSNNTVTDALKELYVTFDKAFLTIFPNFPEQFNSLLRESERLDINPDEPFSTDLRIYALLRMGITDNRRIADFLRCSISTIYTYRSKMKARALNPEKFEDEVVALLPQ